MKNLKMFSAIAVFALAFGTALGNQRVNESAELKEDLLVTAYTRTVPNDPQSCAPLMDVDCTPIRTSTFCTWIETGEKLYDAQCAPLYKPI